MKIFVTFLLSIITLIGFSQTTSLEKEVYNVINNYKIKLNKNSVSLSDTLSKQSKEHTKFMIKNNKLEHAEFINARGEIIQKTNEIGVTDKQTAENILNCFLNSKPHKGIIEMKFTSIGVGIVTDSEGFTWITIRFV